MEDDWSLALARLLLARLPNEQLAIPLHTLRSRNVPSDALSQSQSEMKVKWQRANQSTQAKRTKRKEKKRNNSTSCQLVRLKEKTQEPEKEKYRSRTRTWGQQQGAITVEMSIERHAFPRRVAYQTAIAVGVKHTPGCSSYPRRHGRPSHTPVRQIRLRLGVLWCPERSVWRSRFSTQCFGWPG
jgi:hypothetical protein